MKNKELFFYQYSWLNIILFLIWQEQTIELFDKGNIQSIFIGGFMGAVIILSFEKLNQN